MQNYESSKKNMTDYVLRCAKLYVMVAMSIITTFVLNGCRSTDKSIVFVPDSLRITILDANEPSPFRGVLITEGRHEDLLDKEDAAIQNGCWP